MKLFTPQTVARLRASEDKKGRRIRGYAAVFWDGRAETQYEIWRGLVERIDARAFKRALKEDQDVRALAHHNSSMILGRRQAGTLDLWIDEVGLGYEVLLADTERERDLWIHVERGDVDGSSMTFSPKKVEWQTAKDLEIQTVIDADLREVGPVTFPAYAGTAAEARSRNQPADEDVLELRRDRGVQVLRRRFRELSELGLTLRA
jgi:hypothetical protein